MSFYRITQRSMSNVTLRGLQDALGRTQRLQNELSSGRRVSRPGDDPTAAVSAMTLRSHRSADEQYLRNCDDATGRLNTADAALQTVSKSLIRVRELTVNSQSGSVDDAARSAMSTEITQIRDDVIDQYNTCWLDRPVFGGTVQGTAAVDKATGTYLGDDADISTRIARDATVRVDVKGTDAGADVLPGLLQTLADHIASNDPAVPADLTALDTAMTAVRTSMGDVGARQSRVDTTKDRVDSERLDYTSRISENEDVDLPETIMNLQSQQVAYQSALGAASKILQVSLVDYLK